MSEVLDGTDETLAADKPAADVSSVVGGGPVAAARRWAREHIYALVGVPVGAITLFLLYLHQARATGQNADGSANALQAWDMLHGNLALSHWTLSDVSFYLTELPEYMLVEAVHGLNNDVVHVAAAFTYTLAVLLACWLGRGRARGIEAVVRILIVLVIMLAPGRFSGPLLLGSPDHFGTSVPLLVIFLALDRLPRRPRSAVILFVLLTWAEVSDSTAVFIAGGALAVVAGMRLWQGRGEWRYQASLFAAAVLSIIVAQAAPKIIHSLGGFSMHPPDMLFNSADAMAQAFWTAVKSYLSVFSANFFGLPLTKPSGGGSGVQTQTVITLLHLFGTALVTWGLVVAARRLHQRGSDEAGVEEVSGDEAVEGAQSRGGGLVVNDFVVKLITAGVLINIVGLLFSSQIAGGDREISAALPLGAVVAARLLGPHMVHRKHLVLLSVLVAFFFGALVRNASFPFAAGQGQAAEIWLKQHGYTYGLGGYWSANNLTAESGDKVQVRPINTGSNGIQQYDWESKSTWYDPTKYYANFLVMDLTNPSGIEYATPQQAVKQFGKPDVDVKVGGQEIMVWHQNLLAELPRPK